MWWGEDIWFSHDSAFGIKKFKAKYKYIYIYIREESTMSKDLFSKYTKASSLHVNKLAARPLCSGTKD